MDTKTAEYLFKENRQRFMKDYQDGVNYLLKLTQEMAGCGVTPVGVLVASHMVINHQRKTAEEKVARLEEYARLLRFVWLNPSDESGKQALCRFEREHDAELDPLWRKWQGRT